MGNRADRRASAKIARQAVKRAKTPVEGGILRAAAGFAEGGLLGQLGPHLASAEFDETWLRLTEDLHEILDEHFSDFVIETYLEAGSGSLSSTGPDGTGPNGTGGERGTRLFLCPIVGPQGRMSEFSGSPSEIAGLAASLSESGVSPEGGRCLVFPAIVPIFAFSPRSMGPGRLRALHDALSGRLAASLSGGTAPSVREVRDALSSLCEIASDEATGAEVVFGALLGIELIAFERPLGEEVSLSELEAEDLAKAAAEDSWYDSYAADVPGLAIGAPLDWPACAAALAWETVRIPMEAARERGGLPGDRPATIHCGPTDDGTRLVVSAIYGETAVGPFSVPSDLVWFDADAFFGRAEASAETLVEHDDEGPVIAPLLGIG